MSLLSVRIPLPAEFIRIGVYLPGPLQKSGNINFRGKRAVDGENITLRKTFLINTLKYAVTTTGFSLTSASSVESSNTCAFNPIIYSEAFLVDEAEPLNLHYEAEALVTSIFFYFCFLIHFTKFRISEFVISFSKVLKFRPSSFSGWVL